MPNNSDIVIDITHPSPNRNQRVCELVLHYTALNLEDSLKILTDTAKQVSAHYLVPETAIDMQRKVFELVTENERAWHAGVSSWRKRTNINDTSIGIEIVNLGYKKNEAGKEIWYPFPDYQIQTVIELAKDIVERYKIQPVDVVGHSDIAPERKIDPGPLFPWDTLYENGIGAWFDKQSLKISDQGVIDITRLQKNLRIYGYPIELTGKPDPQTCNVLQAFQMHFRPSNFSGEPDAETVAIIENLVQKYFPSQVQAMSQEAAQEPSCSF
jgi:N-acetylmuramoyl-L-alanine amidase